jgi:uncharacterized protein (DUF433 family)
MVMTETRYAHIVIDDRGRPKIAGTRIWFIHLAHAQQADSLSVEELAREYPDLTLGQIHSTQAYYADHKQELDEEDEREEQLIEKSRLDSNQPTREELSMPLRRE